MSKSTVQWLRDDRKTIKNLSKDDQKNVNPPPDASKGAGYATIMKGKYGTKTQWASRKEEEETYGAITSDHCVAGR
jgi:hypothetical protein